MAKMAQRLIWHVWFVDPVKKIRMNVEINKADVLIHFIKTQ